MSDHTRKALRDAGKITITIEGDHNGNIRFYVNEQAFRLTGIKHGEITKAALDAAEDSDELIRREITDVVRKNHISWEARPKTEGGEDGEKE